MAVAVLGQQERTTFSMLQSIWESKKDRNAARKSRSRLAGLYEDLTQVLTSLSWRSTGGASSSPATNANTTPLDIDGDLDQNEERRQKKKEEEARLMNAIRESEYMRGRVDKESEARERAERYWQERDRGMLEDLGILEDAVTRQASKIKRLEEELERMQGALDSAQRQNADYEGRERLWEEWEQRAIEESRIPRCYCAQGERDSQSLETTSTAGHDNK